MKRWHKMKKKIGLLTFHRPINYGAVLQAVALAKALELCGVDCEIIDYINPAFEKAYPILHKENCSSMKGLIWEFMMVPKRIKQKKGFDAFLKRNANLTKSYSKAEMQKIEKEYDAFIVGSDQVWNLKCSGNDNTYFLDFVKEKPKYSYAASFGDSVVKEENKGIIRNFLSSFSCISVREESGLRILEELATCEFEQSLDPTLLLNKEKWCEIVENTKRLIPEKYVLIYFMVQSPDTVREVFTMANRIKEQYGYKIVVIGGSIRKNRNGVTYYNATSPEEFVTLFRDASYVLTSSFHGTAFSVNFKKDFYSYVKPDLLVQGRIESLLVKLGLEDRIFSKATAINKLSSINYEDAEVKLEVEREKSYTYIEKVLDV